MGLKIEFTDNSNSPAYGEFLQTVTAAFIRYDNRKEITHRQYLEHITKAANAYALALASDPDTLQTVAEKIKITL